MIEVEIHDMKPAKDSFGRETSDQCLFLQPREQGDDRKCPIMIGHNEATAILAALRNVRLQRPMTHDLLMAVIEELGGRLHSIYIHRLEKATFYANLNVRVGDEMVEIDARPSDCVALAVRARAPIYMSEEVIEQVAIEMPDGRRQGRGREKRYEEKATPVTPEQREKLSAYRELMESLIMDDDAEETKAS